jgi:AcrR family transcriptional regulator
MTKAALISMSPRTQRKQTDHRTRVGAERSARTEARILEAALNVFADLGPDAPKIDDFVLAAGISRGTFYNYFDSVEELLEATSEWTTRELVDTIEAALECVDGPALRLGIGLRLCMAKAQSNPTWCRFVARVWKIGGMEAPRRDLEDGVRLGVFRAPSTTVALDLLFGGLREALLRMGNGRTPPGYAAEMTELCLQALGTDPRRIAAVMQRELPSFTSA